MKLKKFFSKIRNIHPWDRLLVSSGLDCSVRVWSLETGECIRSVYTYNGVTRLELSAHHSASITATDGGKLGTCQHEMLLTNYLLTSWEFERKDPSEFVTF